MLDIKKYKEVNNQLKKSKQSISSRLSILRLLSFSAFLFFAYQGSIGMDFGTNIALVFLGIFILLIFIHQKVKSKLDYANMYDEVLNEIDMRIQGKWDTLEYEKDFSSTQSNNTYDLDLLGEHSLYQRICVAQTVNGKENLKRRLLEGFDKKEMELQQKSLVSLSNSEEAVIEYMTISKLYNKQFFTAKRKKSFDVKKLSENYKPFPKLLLLFAYLVNVVMFALLVLQILNMIASTYFLLGFILSTVFTIVLRLSDHRLTGVYDLVYHLSYLQPFLEVLSHMESDSEILNSYIKESKEATKAFVKLQQVSTLLSVNNDGIVGTIVNGFTLLHIHLSAWMGKWFETYGEKINVWLDMIGDVEAMISLLQMKWTNEVVSLPQICFDEKLQISAKQIINPLLPKDKAVACDFDSDTQAYIVTGSNMSGKTTFMRSIALQMTLMQAGGFVTCEQWYATPMKIYTSMRIKDEVKEGISTFYAEILRIKEIMDAKDNQQPMLVLIDEIFKGTNTIDRIICAKETIKQLNSPWCMLFLTTHDTELCELEKDKTLSIHNYYFKESYDDGKITFDYKLREGVSDTKNAQALMKLAGIMK